MVDYTFYKTVYLGSAIAEKQFPGVAARAEAELARLKRTMRVESSGAESEKLAVCAMADVLCAQSKRRGIRSTTVGGVSVSYQDTHCENRELLDAAGVYLDIYRGVGSGVQFKPLV